MSAQLNDQIASVYKHLEPELLTDCVNEATAVVGRVLFLDCWRLSPVAIGYAAKPASWAPA